MALASQVSELLARSLNFRESKQAEAELRSLESSGEFVRTIFVLIGDSNIPMDVRLAASLFFKNLVRRKWTDSDGSYILPGNDVEFIKSQILDLMIASSGPVSKQLGETIGHIANSDFPDRWPNLVPEMVGRLDVSRPAVNNQVLQVAHTIFSRWRSLERSNGLFLEIKMVLEQFTQPYLQLMIESDRQIKQNQNAEWLSSMDLLIKLFYDLNCQDLPEFFEDNMQQFMALLLEYLKLQAPASDDFDEDTPSVYEDIRAGVCEVLALYTERYEEEFAQYMPGFVELCWNLLVSTGLEGRYDLLVNRCLAFLTAVSRFERNLHMFSNQDALVQIIERAIIPNMQMRSSDMELFEDEPVDFVRLDVEGSDNGTRRHASQQFLRQLAAKMESDVTRIVMTYVEKFSSSEQWIDRSTSTALFTSIAAKGQITSIGIATTNPLLDIVQYFQTHMAPQLVGSVPLLQVDAIRFMYQFRNQLNKPQLSQAVPVLATLLDKQQNAAVYTYAAVCLERVLALRDPNTKHPLFTEQDMGGHVKDMSTHTLKLVASGSTKPEELAANEFLVKLLMRILTVSGAEVRRVAPILVPQLVQIIVAVSSNPSNPRFNHYVFESLGACLKYFTDYSTLDQAVVQPLFGILGADVTEFVPYILQILTEILHLQPAELQLPESYQMLLKPVLSPQLWEARGNIPALVGLLNVIVRRGPSLVIEMGLLMPLLGVFQNLLASTARDPYTFELLFGIVSSIPPSNLAQYIPQIAKLLLLRLEKGQSERYSRALTQFVYNVASSPSPLGADYAVQLFEASGNSTFAKLLESVLLPSTPQINGAINRRAASIGITNFLCNSQQFVSGPSASLWSATANALVDLLTHEIATDAAGIDVSGADLDVSEHIFGSAFSPLATTKIPPTDPTASLGVTPQQYFLQQFSKAASSPEIQNLANGSQKLKEFCSTHGL